MKLCQTGERRCEVCVFFPPAWNAAGQRQLQELKITNVSVALKQLRSRVLSLETYPSFALKVT